MLANAYTRQVLPGSTLPAIWMIVFRGQPPVPEGSMRKLQWVYGLYQISETVIEILGSRLRR